MNQKELDGLNAESARLAAKLNAEKHEHGWPRDGMKEYRVRWQKCPHNYNPPSVLFVEAASADDAKKIARDHIERRFGFEWFSIHNVDEAATVPAGRVKQ